MLWMIWSWRLLVSGICYTGVCVCMRVEKLDLAEMKYNQLPFDSNRSTRRSNLFLLWIPFIFLTPEYRRVTFKRLCFLSFCLFRITSLLELTKPNVNFFQNPLLPCSHVWITLFLFLSASLLLTMLALFHKARSNACFASLNPSYAFEISI